MKKVFYSTTSLLAFGLSGPTELLAQDRAPLQVALIETLSGPEAATGALFVTAAEYEIAKLNEDGGYNGQPMKLVLLDSQGTPSGASDRVTEAVEQGIQVIMQGTSSGIAGQIIEDLRRYNTRHPTSPIIYINQAAEARELTGAKCQFYHFKFALDAEMRLKGVAEAIKSEKVEATQVYAINQDYSWGHDIEAAVKRNANVAGYTVVGSTLHDVSKIQDFSPYVSQISTSGADTVITGNWGTDLLRLVKAAVDANLKARFIAMFLDLPGNVKGAGPSAEGQYNVDVFNAEASGNRGLALLEDFRAKTGTQDMVNSHFRAILALQFLGEALKQVDPVGGKINVKAIAMAMERTKLDSAAGVVAMRPGDHQAILPMTITQVSKDAAVKVEGTEFGFRPVVTIAGENAITPVQDTCKMQRAS
ncbi:ABC transporter substrate-binding protein [Mesorhizobium sp. M0684]|uniref:ABC transporter substrate-binding protein n=1 Tax=Mesorhizobium sp. M0684 TaxID=2956986 RepID=UPI00333DD39D